MCRTQAWHVGAGARVPTRGLSQVCYSLVIMLVLISLRSLSILSSSRCFCSPLYARALSVAVPAAVRSCCAACADRVLGWLGDMRPMGMYIRGVLAACVLRPAPSQFCARGHSVRFVNPALQREKLFSVHEIVRVSYGCSICPVRWGRTQSVHCTGMMHFF